MVSAYARGRFQNLMLSYPTAPAALRRLIRIDPIFERQATSAQGASQPCRTSWSDSDEAFWRVSAKWWRH